MGREWGLGYKLDGIVLSFNTLSAETVLWSAVHRLVELLQAEGIRLDNQEFVEITLKGKSR